MDRLENVPGRPCSVAAALDVVGDKWALLIVRELLFGNHRFTEIVRNTAAPRDRLAARLRDLVEAGVIEKRQYQVAPERFEYHLTASGRALAPVLQSLLAWGDRFAVDEPPMTLQHHDHELKLRSVCAVCGERVHREDVHRVSRRPGWDEAGPVPVG